MLRMVSRPPRPGLLAGLKGRWHAAGCVRGWGAPWSPVLRDSGRGVVEPRGERDVFLFLPLVPCYCILEVGLVATVIVVVYVVQSHVRFPV